MPKHQDLPRFLFNKINSKNRCKEILKKKICKFGNSLSFPFLSTNTHFHNGGGRESNLVR